MITRFGGQVGVRDPRLLESALSRPRSGYYDTLSLQAAALLQSPAMNHPCVDGNKRVAFALTAVFLRMNGLRPRVPASEGEPFLVETVIEKRADIADIATWLESHCDQIG